MYGPCYDHRRDALLYNYIKPNSLCIIGSWPEQHMTDDVEYTYRSDSNLYYYSGFEEPNCCIVLEKYGPMYTFIMFVQKKDPDKEVRTGFRYGPSGTKERFNADHSYEIGDFENIIGPKIDKCDNLYTYIPDTGSSVYLFVDKVELDNNIDIIDLKPIMEKQRVKKTPYEIDLIRKSCQLTAEAHKLAMSNTKVGMSESQLDGLITGFLMRNGCKRLAYPNIVASGNNATTLHYLQNSDTLKDGNLVLIDGGGELNHYASDISRTYPINGIFTPEQREIYQIVLNAQKACIDEVWPGRTIWDIHRISCRIITEGLIKLGLLTGTLKHNLKEKLIRNFICMELDIGWV